MKSVKTMKQTGPVTASNEFFALVDEVRGHVAFTHKLLEAQKVETPGSKAGERGVVGQRPDLY